MDKVKKLFSTPKKAILTSVCILLILALVGTGSAYAASAIASSSAIGVQNAQNFAFADAGVDPVSATEVHTEFDFALGQFVYEVEFVADQTHYEYVIKSSDGTILKKNVSILQTPSAGVQNQTDASSSAQITQEQAKEIALKNAGVEASKVTFTKQKLDYDDGVLVYDIEFYTSSQEYEYEINALTGEVYKRSAESFRPNANSGAQNNGSATITAARAKTIAAAQFGFSVDEVTFKKTKMERDDGYTVYEVEFYKGRMEYECTIDANTGTVLEYDSDWDD